MLQKIQFATFYLFDLVFTVTGLLYIKTVGEAITGLLFLLCIWFIMWSVAKWYWYSKEKIRGTFLAFYFRYLAQAFEIFGNEKRLGPTKLFRLTSVSLSLIVGSATIIFLLYINLSTIEITADLAIRYAQLLFYVVAMPLVIYFAQNVMSGRNDEDLVRSALNFFPLKFTQMFMYIFTFLTPVAWLALSFLSYILVKGKVLQRKI